MKFKPKEILVNLPIALLFDQPWEIASFAANLNTILHGKTRLKAEELGSLGGRYVGLFYLQRNNEYKQLYDEFIRLIEEEQTEEHDMSFVPSSIPPPPLPEAEMNKIYTYSCDQCGLSFNREDNLSFHYQYCEGKKIPKEFLIYLLYW